MQVEIVFAGHPFLVALGEERGDEAQAGRGVGEDRSDAGMALDLAVDAFEAVGGAQSGPQAVRQIEDGAKPSGRFSSAQAASLGASRFQSSRARRRSRSASALSGALKRERMRCANGLRWSRRVT